jgi:hypothetical protein
MFLALRRNNRKHRPGFRLDFRPVAAEQEAQAEADRRGTTLRGW